MDACAFFQTQLCNNKPLKESTRGGGGVQAQPFLCSLQSGANYPDWRGYAVNVITSLHQNHTPSGVGPHVNPEIRDEKSEGGGVLVKSSCGPLNKINILSSPQLSKWNQIPLHNSIIICKTTKTAFFLNFPTRKRVTGGKNMLDVFLPRKSSLSIHVEEPQQTWGDEDQV